jgi:hypothetical protein
MEHNPQPAHQPTDATTTHNIHPVIAEPIKQIRAAAIAAAASVAADHQSGGVLAF